MALPKRRRLAPSRRRPVCLVVGGGVAGVSCAAELASLGAQTLLLTASPALRQAAVLSRLTPHLEVSSLAILSSSSSQLLLGACSAGGVCRRAE